MIIDAIAALVGPITNLIDDLHTSDEERLKAKAKLLELQNQLMVQALQYEKALIDQKAQIITAEAQGESWLQRSWRPITMLTFLGLVVADQTGLLAFRLAPEAWTLLQIGLGGYVVGRSAEKIVPKAIEAVRR